MVGRKVFIAEVLDEDEDSVTLRVLRRDDVTVDVQEGMQFYSIVFTDEHAEQHVSGEAKLQ